MVRRMGFYFLALLSFLFYFLGIPNVQATSYHWPLLFLFSGWLSLQPAVSDCWTPDALNRPTDRWIDRCWFCCQPLKGGEGLCLMRALTPLRSCREAQPAGRQLRYGHGSWLAPTTSGEWEAAERKRWEGAKKSSFSPVRRSARPEPICKSQQKYKKNCASQRMPANQPWPTSS